MNSRFAVGGLLALVVLSLSVWAKDTGVIDITKAKAACPEADAEATRIADEFLKNENESIETLKTYL